MKNKFSIVTIACFAAAFVLFSAVQVEAQLSPGLGRPATVFNTANVNAAVAGCTNSLATGLSVTNTFDCSAGTTLGLQLDVAASAASTSNLTAVVYRGIGNNTYEQTAFSTVTLAAAGTATQTLYTNLTIGAAQKVRLIVSTTALSSAPLTNTVIRAAVK